MAGFGGGVLLLPVFTAMFGLRTAVPMLTLTQLSSNGSRMWLNRRALHWPMIGWFALGTVPSSVAGGLLLTRAPLAPLQRLLGVFLIAVVVWRRLRPTPRQPATTAFAGIGAASGFGSALLGSVGPLTAPFFLAARLTRGAYIGTEAASALTMHLTKVRRLRHRSAASGQVLLYGLALTPATLLGAWVGKNALNRTSDRLFVLLVEAGLVVAGLLFLLGV